MLSLKIFIIWFPDSLSYNLLCLHMVCFSPILEQYKNAGIHCNRIGLGRAFINTQILEFGDIMSTQHNVFIKVNAALTLEHLALTIAMNIFNVSGCDYYLQHFII